MASLIDLIHQAGFKGQAAQTMYAIVMAESGGNAHAHNGNSGTGDNSYGLAQINMLGSMGPARLAQYHLKSNDDLFDPLTNLRVAYQMSGGGTNFSPWTTYTRGTYKQYTGNQTAQVSSSSNGQAVMDSSSGAAGSGLSAADYRDALGTMGGLLNTIPELNDILKQATAGGWTAAKFQQAVQSSSWYRTHGAATRELVALRAADPAEYKARVTSAQHKILATARQVGYNINSSQLQGLVNRLLTEGLDDTTLAQAIAAVPKITAATKLGDLKGQFAATATQLQTLASQYGQNWAQSSTAFRAQQILEGSQTIDTYKQQLIAQAKSMFPGLIHQLDSGMTIADAAAPYQQSMASTLELSPNAVSLNDPLIKRALQGVTTSTGDKATSTLTPVWQFEQQLRSDPRWQFTKNSRDTVSSALVHIGQDWGFGF